MINREILAAFVIGSLLAGAIAGCELGFRADATNAPAPATTPATAPNLAAPSKETSSQQIEDGGTGTFKAIAAIDGTLPTHTVFRPKDLAPFGEKTKLPILAWGNGACANSPSGHQNFLNEIASHGYIVVAIGPLQPGGARGAGGGGGATSSAQLIQAIDWAIAQNANKESQYFGKIDTTRLAIAGMSCGGLQALHASADPRVTASLICNSGIYNTNLGTAAPPPPASAPAGGAPAPARASRGRAGSPGTPDINKDHLAKLHGPILYILGGPTDIAYENGMDDYRRIEKLPAAAANMDVGHGGTYSRPHGGEFSPVAVAWLNWHLKGNQESAKMFTGATPEILKNPQWKFEKKNIP